MLKLIVPIFALAVMVFGMVDQMRLLFRYKDSKTVSFARTLLAMICSVLWMFYAWEIKNLLLVYTNILSFILSSALAVIIWHYRK